MPPLFHTKATTPKYGIESLFAYECPPRTPQKLTNIENFIPALFRNCFYSIYPAINFRKLGNLEPPSSRLIAFRKNRSSRDVMITKIQSGRHVIICIRK